VNLKLPELLISAHMQHPGILILYQSVHAKAVSLFKVRALRQLPDLMNQQVFILRATAFR